MCGQTLPLLPLVEIVGGEVLVKRHVAYTLLISLCLRDGVVQVGGTGGCMHCMYALCVCTVCMHCVYALCVQYVCL